MIHINFDNSVLVAVIAGIFSVIVGLISLLASKKVPITPSKRDIYLEQLTKVWEPLDRLLSLSQTVDSVAALKSINTVVHENYKLIPKELLCEVISLNRKNELSPSDLRKASEIIGSYFHWTKKYLGYPYDRKKIKIEYSPRSGMDIFFVTFGNLVLLAVFCLGAIAFVGSITLLYMNNRLSFKDHLTLIITLLGMLSILWMVAFQPRK